MLKGYFKAASLRYQLEMGVTAGYDSRMLFLASLDVPCRYFVLDHWGEDCDVDVKMGVIVGKAHNRVVEVGDWQNSNNNDWQLHEESFDFPKRRFLSYWTSERLLINGHVNGIARGQYRAKKIRDGLTLAQFNGLDKHTYPVRLYSQWLQSLKLQIHGYEFSDLFYWEERTAHWSAKQKTEAGLYLELYSPFTSRALLRHMLSVDKKYRDSYVHRLYLEIIRQMSPVAARIPINPTPKSLRIQRMKRLGVHYFFRKQEALRKIMRSLIPWKV
jgi:hypothetical protein